MHGEPNGLVRLRLAHLTTMVMKPMSLPPICSVTRPVLADRALSCGGLTPGRTSWGEVMSAVVAPPQLTSVSEAPIAAAVNEG